MKLEEILQQHQLQQCHAGNQELERTWEQVLGGCSEGQSTWIEELENKKISTEFPLAHKTDMPHSIQKSHILVIDHDITSVRDFLIADKFNQQSVEQTIPFFFRLYILQLITLAACASNLATFWLSEAWDTASLCQPEIAILFDSHSLR